jgi:hypothetical protein
MSGQFTPPPPSGFTTEGNFRGTESVADSGCPTDRLGILEKRRLLFVTGVETRTLGPISCRIFLVASSSNSFFVLSRFFFLKVGIQNAKLRIEMQATF